MFAGGVAMQQFLLVGSIPDEQTYPILIGLGAVILIYLAVLRPKMRKKKDPLDQPPARATMAQQRALERDMQTLLVEYEQMIRNMTSQLDTRAAKLELLIKEADEKLAALRAANAGSIPAYSAASAESAAVAEPEAAAIARATDLTPTPRRDPTGPDPRHAEVYALADQGLPARDVARRTGIPHGEIELMLNIRASSSKRSAATT
jgi:hypothetical protein